MRQTGKLVIHGGLKTAAAGMFVFGLIIMASGLITNNGSSVSMLLLLQGITIVCLSILLYFVSPARHIDSQVCDAMAFTNMQNIGTMLSSWPIKGRGIYVPAKGKGPIIVVFPGTPTAKGKEMIPPGYGLYQYARSIGASFTEEGIENEMRDLMKNSLELAADVTATIDKDRAGVTLKGLANIGLCTSLREEDSRICCRIGCPVCSLAGCIIVDATKRKARITNLSVKEDCVNILYELL